ncbi:MAG: TIR domain-containing protein [Candidatus Paceibacterota bacterium]
MEYIPPKMFIGSSSEALKQKIPHLFRDYLDEYVDGYIWDALPEFNIANTTMDALCTAANEYDFALLILTADDKVRSRGKEHIVPRDNVLLELGLFLGAIGADRTFVSVESNQKGIKLPSDIGSGSKAPRFSLSNEAAKNTSIRKACHGFGKKITKEGRRQIELKLAKKWRYSETDGSFDIRVSAAQLERYRATIGSRELAIVARIWDEEVEDEQDTRIVVGNTKRVPRKPSGDLLFRIPVMDIVGKQGKKKLGLDDVLEGHVMLVPEGGDPSTCDNITQMIESGCHKSDTVTFHPGIDKDKVPDRRKTVKKANATTTNRKRVFTRTRN